MILDYSKLGALLLVSALALAGCRDGQKAEPAKPWVHKSVRAPYELTVPPQWAPEAPAVVNEFADVAVTRDHEFFFIVIPQGLPEVPGADRPDALSLKRASVEIMKTQIEDLEIERQGPVRVDGRDGHSVVAHGKSGGHQISYVATYVVDGLWGFQLVGWAPRGRSKELVAHVDGLLGGFSFTTAVKPAAAPSIEDAGRDAGSAPDVVAPEAKTSLATPDAGTDAADVQSNSQ